MGLRLKEARPSELHGIVPSENDEPFASLINYTENLIMDLNHVICVANYCLRVLCVLLSYTHKHALRLHKTIV